MSNTTEPKEIKDYILKDDIGEGNFGKVKLGISKKTGEKFAIKIINKDQIKKKMKNKIFRENEVITKFNHINVIFVFEIIEDPENYYIIMEYCKRGELFDYIVDHEHLTEDEASIFFYQLINGVEYIHSKGIAHRDLKPENLLLTKDKTLKIIDFGLSHEFDGIDLLKTKCGSPSYASPEILKGKPYDGFKSDIWCCGIILYAMVCGYLPFDGETNKILFKNIIKCEPEIPDYLDDSTQDLIIKILTSDPDMRITIDEIKKHRFYLRGKRLCHIDYKLVEKNVLKKRKNKSSFRLNEDDNTYFIAENNLDYDEDFKKQIIQREENIINEIINEVNNDKKEIEKENINNKIKTIDLEINNKDINNKEYNNKNQIKTISNVSNKETSIKNNSISNYSNDLNNFKNNRNNSNNNYQQNNINNKFENFFKDSLINERKKNNSRKEPIKQIKNINEIHDIISTKLIDNKENINFKTNNNIELNNFNKEKKEKITKNKNNNNNLFLDNNIKGDKFSQFLQNIGKNMHLNTHENESKLKIIKNSNCNTEKNQKVIQYKSPDKLFMNNYIPNTIMKGNINLSNKNDNQIFARIITGFNNNIFNNSNLKKNIFFNMKYTNKNKNTSNEHSNIKFHFENNNIESINNSNKNKIIKINKSPDKLSLNSLHQIKLINLKPSNKDTQNLYYNNINININNYNIKEGKNKLNGNYMNYLSTDNQLNYKFNKKNSITNLHSSKKLYLNTENNKIINNNYMNKTEGNKENKIPSRTQENFYKPKKKFNFDKISFHSSYNDKKGILDNKNNLKFNKNFFGNYKNQNEKIKTRGGSQGKSMKNSHLDNFLQTIAATGFYKNKKGNKKIYFCGPINIKVNNNNYNVNHNSKNHYLPLMIKK